jgi:hypothetical protein
MADRDDLARIYAEHFGTRLTDLDDLDWELFDRILAAGWVKATDDEATIERVIGVAWHEFRYPRPAVDEPTDAFRRAIRAALRALYPNQET